MSCANSLGSGRDDISFSRQRVVKLKLSLFCAAIATAMLMAIPAWADADDVLAGLFDAVVGVPFATTMLGVVRSGEQIPTTPAVLDERLRTVEQLLAQLDDRLQQLQVRVDQLQDEEVKTQNISRLREYQRFRGAISLINTELMTHPADPGRRIVLEAAPRQQADMLRDTPGFDLWMWTDIDPQTQLIRTRFHTAPSFELYSLALTTWLDTLAVLYADRPQVLVAEAGGALQQHAAFLRVRPGWRELLQPPVELPEYLNAAVFCRPAAMQTYADAGGACRFGTDCLDNIDGTQAQGEQFTLQMNQDPPGTQTLCTWDVNRQWDFPLQDKLRNDHGELLMTTLADALEKVATTGSQASRFVGTFPDWVMTPIYSTPLDQPFEAPIASKLGATPVIASCSVIGCRLPASGEGYWQLAISSQPHIVRNQGSSLCLDVKNNTVAPYTGRRLKGGRRGRWKTEAGRLRARAAPYA